MENYEINLWEYLQILYRRKIIIIGVVLVCVLAAYAVSNYVFEKRYQTEAWIKLNQNFLLTDPKDPSAKDIIPLDYIKSHFYYPEVMSDVTKDLNINASLRGSLSFSAYNGLVQVIYNHPANANSSKLLDEWINNTKFKMIEEESRRHLLTLEDDVTTAKAELQKELARQKEISALLITEGQTNAERLVKNRDAGKTYFIREESASYSDLAIQDHTSKITTVELQNKLQFMDQLLSDYKTALVKIRQMLTTPDGNADDLETEFNSIRVRYNAYLHQKDADTPPNVTIPTVAIQPFQIVSEPFTKTGPVAPNVKLNVILAGFLSLVFVVFLVLIVEYAATMSKKSKKDLTA